MTEDDGPAVIARAVAEEHVDAFTTRDLQRSRDVLNYPSVRLASGRVRIWERPEDYSIPWDLLVETEGWHHSTLDSVEIVQAGTDEVLLVLEEIRGCLSDGRVVTPHGVERVVPQLGHPVERLR
jgi:hypothetical protein